MCRNISHLPLYFLKSSFQFSCCTIFSIVPLILWVFVCQQLYMELHGASRFFCQKMVLGGQVRKLQLRESAQGRQLAQTPGCHLASFGLGFPSQPWQPWAGLGRQAGCSGARLAPGAGVGHNRDSGGRVSGALCWEPLMLPCRREHLPCR